MLCRTVSRAGSRRLILFFAGWAMDATPFGGLHRPGYDVAVVWDYASPDALPDFGRDYDEICVVAWSLGVAAASAPMPFDDKITRRIAIAGTTTPVDDSRGIPRAIFEATRQAVSPAGMARFYRRMAGGARAAADFAAHGPNRSLESLRAELDLFLNDAPAKSASARWDLAVIPVSDAIFPLENQRRAWQGTPVEEIESPHLVDIQSILDRHIVDKDYAGERFAHRRARYDEAATVQNEMCERMASHIGSYPLPEGDILEVGCGTGLLSRRLEPLRRKLILWDLADAGIGIAGAEFRQCDAETEIRSVPDSSLAAVVTASTVQWFNSPARFFAHCRRVLRPGGLLAVGTYAKGNLHEVADATGMALALPDADGWTAMLPAGLKPVGIETYTRRLTFGSAADIFRHLSATGVNSLSRERSAASLRKAMAAMRPDADGLFAATYIPCIFYAIRQ